MTKTDLPANERPSARPIPGSATHTGAWGLVEIAAPVTTTLGPTRWRSRDVAFVALLAVVATVILTGAGQGQVGGGEAARPLGSAGAAAPAATSGAPASSASTLASSGSLVTLRAPVQGARVGPGLVQVTLNPGPHDALTIQVGVGPQVVGSLDVRGRGQTTVTTEVPVLGPHADVPAEVRVRVGGASGPLAGVVPVILTAAPPAGLWEAALVDGDRSILASGYAALSVDTVWLTASAGRAVLGSTRTAVVGGSLDQPVSAPFGVGTWSAALHLARGVSGGDDLSLTFGLAWDRSPAGPAGSTMVVLSVGDGRGGG